VAGRTTLSSTFKSFSRMTLPAIAICPGFKSEEDRPEAYKGFCDDYKEDGTESFGNDGMHNRRIVLKKATHSVKA